MPRLPHIVPPLHFAIPTNLEIAELERTYTPAFAFKRDVCASFLNLLYIKHWELLKKKKERRIAITGREWVHLKKRYLAKNLHGDIGRYIKWLEVVGVIEVSHFFNRGRSSKGYRLASPYSEARIQLHRVTDWRSYKTARRTRSASEETVVSDCSSDDDGFDDHPPTASIRVGRIRWEAIQGAYSSCGFEWTPCWQLNSAENWYSNGDNCLCGSNHSDCECRSPFSSSVNPFSSSDGFSSGSSSSPSLSSRSTGVGVLSLYNGTLFGTCPSISQTESHLEKCFRSVKLESAWREFIGHQYSAGTWTTQQANYAEWSGQRIEDEAFWFGRSHNGRLNTNVTSLPSEMRQFLVLDGCESLTEIDVRASQPYLLTGLMRWSKRCGYPAPANEAIAEWAELVSGQADPYESFAARLAAVEGRTVTREEAKDGFLTILFSRNQQVTPFKKLFTEAFPEVDQFVRRLKRGRHQECAVLLQQYEAAIVIERVCARLAALNIPLLTVHDSLIVTTGDETRARAILGDELQRTVGTRPFLRTNDLDS